MNFKFHHILAFLYLTAFVARHAASSPEDYWKSVLPHSPMPQTLKDMLNPTDERLEADKSTTVGVNKGGVNVNTGRKGKPDGTTVNVGHGGTSVNVGGGHGHSPFVYKYAATETQLHDNPNVALFFLEKDLHPGKEMNVKFTTTVNGVKFLPRNIADSIPFSSKHFPQILGKFSLTPKSPKAEAMQKTLKECEEKSGMKGEEKFCATSLEAMVDFAAGKLGGGAAAISTNAENETLKKYRVSKIKKMPSEGPVVVCHKMEYAYAVFYCHGTAATEAYEVSMAAGDGSRAEAEAEAVAVCHRDTAAWNPKHLAFQVLKVEPGSVPVCHFLPDDHIVWVRKN